MKKFFIFIFCILSVLLSKQNVKAVEVKVDGLFIISAFSYNGLNFNKDSANTANSTKNSGFDVWQRFQMGIDFTASENLSGRFMFRAPNVALWGQDDFTLGTRSANKLQSFQINEAYVDWIIPTTDISVTIGMQGFGINYLFNSGSPIMDDFAPGIVINVPLSNEIELNLSWLRLDTANENTNYLSNNDNYADFFMLSMPYVFDDMNITPHFAFASVGNDAELSGYGGSLNPFEDNVDIYYAGINTELTFNKGLSMAADFLYSWADGNNNNKAKAQAWLADMALAYNTGNGTLKLFGWYASGDEASDVKDDKYGRIIAISGGWGTVRSAFFDLASLGLGVTSGVVSPTGTWAAALEYDGYNITKNIELGGHLMWINGTNDSSISYFDGTNERNPSYMSSNDSVVDVSAWAEYKMYKELQVNFNISYLIAQFEESDYSGEEEDGFRTGLTFIYTF